MSVLDSNISLTPRSLVGPIAIGVALMWLLAAGRWRPKKKSGD